MRAPKRLLAVFVTIALAVTPALVGTGALAQPDDLPMTIDPDSGPPGTMIFVEGSECPVPPNTKVSVWLFKLGGDPFFELVAAAEADPDEAGNWDATLTVPEDAEPGDYQVQASCQAGEDFDPEVDGQYEPQPFEVTPGDLPMTVDPGSGPPGTEIHVSGSDCPVPPNTEVFIMLSEGLEDDPIAHAGTVPDETGEWATTLTVPPDAEPGDYLVSGFCQAGEEPSENDLFYETQPFEVEPDEERRPRTVGLAPAPLRNLGVARGRVRLVQPNQNRPRCFRRVLVRVQRRPLAGGAWRVIRTPRTNARGVYRTANRIVRRDGQPLPGRYRAIAPRLTFTAPDGTEVTCLRAVSPVRRVPRV